MRAAACCSWSFLSEHLTVSQSAVLPPGWSVRREKQEVVQRGRACPGRQAAACRDSLLSSGGCGYIQAVQRARHMWSSQADRRVTGRWLQKTITTSNTDISSMSALCCSLYAALKHNCWHRLVGKGLVSGMTSVLASLSIATLADSQVSYPPLSTGRVVVV